MKLIYNITIVIGCAICVAVVLIAWDIIRSPPPNKPITVNIERGLSVKDLLINPFYSITLEHGPHNQLLTWQHINGRRVTVEWNGTNSPVMYRDTK